ncbi:barstar family protein [Gordonia sp. PKS22-38]|uniref:Barstar family protein n=1 Tax=Gordonia prachuapensis TaxID=3115651 RepID=A0ABU7MPV2_9ACTN|nr:barstar family protein [Gordonia sp. PKS22-38]
MSAARIPRVPADRFLTDAGRDGPVVGVVVGDRTPDDAAGVVVRRVDGREMPTIATMLDEFARAWQFPEHFGHNRDAFDDCMRDLDGMLPDDEPRPTTFVTVVDHAESLLRREPDQLRWLANSLSFYREHYRDVATPSAGFAVLLLTPQPLATWVENRWQEAGSDIAEIEDL